MYIQVAPLDAEFPHIVRVSDPGYVREMLTAGVPDNSASVGYAVTAIRYRPGQRHVLRYDPVGGPERTEGHGTVFAKVYNSNKGARTFDLVTRIAEALATQSHGLTIVHPLAYLATDEVVLYPYVSGTPLAQLLRTPGRATANHLRRAGAALKQRAPTALHPGVSILW